MNRTEGKKQTGDRLPDTLGPVTGSSPAPPSSRQNPAYQTPIVFQLSRSAVHRLWAAVDRGDTNLLPPLAAALVGLIALGDLSAGDRRAGQEFNALKLRLSAVEAIAGTPMKADYAAKNNVLDHLRATARIIERLWKTIELGATPDQSGQFVSAINDADGHIKKDLELLSSFLEVFEPQVAEKDRWDTIREDLQQGRYVLRISNNNSNTTYNFGHDVLNNNWTKVFVYSDGIDRKTPTLAERQDKTMEKIRNAIGDRFVPDALHDTLPKDAGCMMGTRVDVLTKFVSWARYGPMRIFWLAGLAGTGKTSITLTLCRMLQDDPNILLGGSFFCSRTVSKEQRADARRILPTLAIFLAEKCPEFAAALEKELSSSANPRAPYMDASIQIESLLRIPLASLSTSKRTILFVIDALDECSDDSLVQRLLQAVASLTCKAKVKFILTSRPETHIAHSPIFNLNHSTILRLHTIDKTEVTSDILLYIDDTFSKQPLSTVWYTQADVSALATRSDGLFVFASTMAKYITDGRGPEARIKRLRTALSAGHDSRVAFGPLDEMYDLVLTRASDGKEVEPSELEASLHALACILSARSPLSIMVLAELLERDAEDLRGSLERLYAVLYVPEQHDVPGIRTVHASFGDYLLARAASNVRISRWLGDEILIQGCFRNFKNRLVFNISRSGSSYEPMHHFEFPSRYLRHDIIPVSLEYTCMHWVDHLMALKDPSAMYQEVHDIFRPRALFWIEAMSTLHEIQRAIGMLKDAYVKIGSVEVSEFLRDAHDFLVSFREPIERSPPHIYLSALPFEPKASLVHQTFAPMYKGIIAVDFFGICISDRRFRQTVESLPAHAAPVNSIAVSADGAVFVSGSDDSSIRVWDTQTGEPKYPPLLGHTDAVLSVAIGLDGRLIATASEDHTVRFWDLQAGLPVGEPLLGHEQGVTAVLFAPNSLWIVSGSRDGTVRIWDIATGQPSHASPLRCLTAVSAIAFSPDCQTIASGDRLGCIGLWKAETGELLRSWKMDTFEHSPWPFWLQDEGIISLEFSSSGTHILSRGHGCPGGRGPDGIFSQEEFVGGVWDVTTGQHTCVLKGNGHHGHQNVLSYSKNGRLIVSGSRCFPPDGRCNVRVWDATTGENIATASAQGNSVSSVAFTPEGQSIVAGCGKEIRVWDLFEAHAGNSGDCCDPVTALTSSYFRNGLNRSNWITGPSGELLLWVPPEHQPYLQGGALKLVIGSGRCLVSRDPGGLHHGLDWAKCWR